MASGRIELHSTGLTGIDLGFDWVSTPNAANNSSTVSITSCQYRSTVYGGTWLPGGTIKINGQTVVTMASSAPRTHNFVTSAKGTWYDIRIQGTGTLPPWTTGAIAHNADGSMSVTIEISIELWSQTYNPYLAKFSTSQTVALDKLSGKTYKLTLSQAANTTLTVKRGGTALANGATITHGDVLTVTFGASTGYNASCTVNGGAVASGATHTVSGAVTVASTASLKTYKLTLSQAANTTLTVKRGGTALTNGASISHFDVLTVTFGASTGYNASCTVNGGAVASGATHTVTGAVTVATTASLKTYKLTITQGGNTTLTVKRGGTALTNGAVISHGDVLTVTFGASTGYNASCTVNGGAVASGATHTVTGAVTVASSASLKTYKLTITQAAHCTITVTRTASRGGGTGALSTGATLYHFDALTISIVPAAGYTITSRTPAGNVTSVTGNVTVSAAASPQATVRLWNGSGWDSYLVYVYTGSGWALHQAYVYTGSGWESCY